MSVPPRFVLESLVRLDGSVHLHDAYAAASSLGIADQALRLAARRVVQEGSFTQDGRGRASVLRRTPQADLVEQHDAQFVEFAHLQDSGAAPWDGRWQLLGVSIPEGERPLRDRLRRTLLRLGAGHLQPGLYVSPHDLHALAVLEAPELASLPGLVLATTTALEVGGRSDPRQVAALVWSLEAVADLHRTLDEVATRTLHRGRRAETGPSRTAAALELAWAFDRAHVDDPLLPPELLPDDWLGARARASFAEAWDDVTDPDADSVALFARFARP